MGEQQEKPEKPPMVRREWLIAMGIVFVALMALVFTFCSSGTLG
jgi:hypothetical protein